MSGNQIVMGGRGFYNAHSQLQHSAIQYSLPFLERALAEVPLPEGDKPFVVADYGSSEGRNSMAVMAIIIRAMRTRTPPSLPISIVHIDQPANDFSSLFTLLHSSPDSYLRHSSGVFAYAAGGNFYSRMFPDRQVSLGWSSIAVHWLSRLPAAVPDHISSGHAPPTIRTLFAEQARKDWACFLEHRAHELHAGGRLIVLAGSSDAGGLYGGELLYNVANGVLHEMVREGRLHRPEYERMTVPTYHRTVEEFVEPIVKGPMASRLRLKAQSQITMADPLWEEYGTAGDIQTFASKQTAWLRAWSEPSLFRHLNDDRDATLRREIIEEFYGRVGLAILNNPTAACCAWRIVLLDIEKV